ncbi:MAG TPA: hypothetical protein DGH68_06975 [Bacteroidetes bacterium]|nr:hypothetical protein [Bacteroidota bacterium]
MESKFGNAESKSKHTSWNVRSGTGALVLLTSALTIPCPPWSFKNSTLIRPERKCYTVMLNTG